MDVTYSAVTYIVLALTALYILNILRNWTTSTAKNFPPGPRCLPLIGNLHIIDFKEPQHTLTKLSKIYGSVFSIQMGMKKMVVLAGYETVKDALVNHAEEFGERARIPIFQKIDKRMGIIFSQGDYWKVMRRFTFASLRAFGMGKSSIEDKIFEECDHLTQRFESFKGKPFDNTMILNAAFANIILSILLGHRMEYEDPTFLRVLSLTNEGLRHLGAPMTLLYNICPVLGFLPGSHKSVLNKVKVLDALIKSMYVRHIQDLDVNDQRSFIDAFLVRQKKEERNPQSYFHHESLTSVVRNMLCAGLETTATTLRWGLLLMMKYPDIQEKVQEEITRVIGSAQPNYNHHTKMPFTNAVMHEIQRFAVAAPMGLPHETTKDVNFKGYLIPKGTFIIPLLTSVLHDKTQFEEPDQFNPNHFLDSEGNFIKKAAFMPFSAGPRVCAGETLARMEVFIFFTNLLQKFTFRPPSGVTDVNLNSGIGVSTKPLPHMICAIPHV
ncbi:cytochrome P450 2K1-like [Ascaphus truei]|uniref:cytochrome P450 2K1-like n=1 Tax=Ascaphus truei TaxID=8439 RepID=UPI003F5A54DF